MASMLSISRSGNHWGKVERLATGCPDGDEHGVVARGDFRIDLGSRCVAVRGCDVQLDEEEFEMLVFLIGHHTSIITPQTRLATRWRRGRVRRADFLRVIASLQKKLESVAGGARYIRTEPWIVCRFDPGGGGIP
jgi:DNA-binding response OmpR family regulator